VPHEADDELRASISLDLVLTAPADVPLPPEYLAPHPDHWQQA
jgi:hypothetical protein